jgi:Zn-dependent protease with chaperone function
MKTWFAKYYSSRAAGPVEATLLATDHQLSLGWRNDDGSSQTETWELNKVSVLFENSSGETKITHTSRPGQFLEVEGREAFEFIITQQEEQRKPWLKKRNTKDTGRAAFILGSALALLVTCYFLLVPWLSEKLAGTVSIQTEDQFGNSVYDALDLERSKDGKATIIANEFMKAMHISTDYSIKVTVVKSEIVNAFALPGGHIVVYTGLLNRLQSYPELAALLGHEFTHVNNRHATRSIFRQMGSRIFFAVLFGRFGSVTGVLVDQAERFKSLHYSRSLEKEADLSALDILKERNIDPKGFTDLFQHLKESAPASEMPEFLESHPDIDKRVHYITTAAKGSRVVENAALKSIFEKLK